MNYQERLYHKTSFCKNNKNVNSSLKKANITANHIDLCSFRGKNMNKRFNSKEDILDFAIAKEEEAAKFYSDLAKKPVSEGVKEFFEDFAQMETGHKKTLEEIKKGNVRLKNEVIQGLSIAEIAEEAQINENTTFIDALVFAMKREHEAYRLYVELAAAAETEEILDIFVLLAQQEARHRLWFETEYKNAVESPVLGNSN